MAGASMLFVSCWATSVIKNREDSSRLGCCQWRHLVLVRFRDGKTEGMYETGQLELRLPVNGSVSDSCISQLVAFPSSSHLMLSCN
jgi:hypothetical protein